VKKCCQFFLGKKYKEIRNVSKYSCTFWDFWEHIWSRFDQCVRFINWCEIFNMVHHMLRAMCNYLWLAIENGSKHYSREKIGFCGPLIKSPFQLFSSSMSVITVRVNGFDKTILYHWTYSRYFQIYKNKLIMFKL